MGFCPFPLRGFLQSFLLLLSAVVARCETFRVATFNLHDYLDAPAATRPAKSAESKAAVRESILALKPDVIALQEVGSTAALSELQASLASSGLELPHHELVFGADTNIHLAVLSRFPIVASRPHTNDQFLLSGRRFRVSRGFAEIDIQVAPGYTFTLLAAHLKSRRTAYAADEAEWRFEEARLLREKIDARLTANPNLNLVVLGDLNDTPDSNSTRAILGRGNRKLIDTRPLERNHEETSRQTKPTGEVAWTYYYVKTDSYSRIDYLLLSPGMAREWITNETFVLGSPRWSLASDHRPLVASFRNEDQ